MNDDSFPIPPRWHRELVPDDVETARGIVDLHCPTGIDPDRPVCASATHLIVTPSWPCRQHRWAEWVLDLAQRGEVAGAAHSP
ncbi:hypothetical protein [Cryptosporangium sp. NPDC051539]|uniref:hypothetical protein n=1 Tax=Cryptosporangium sp. NPDC051539 TaxID=3363962 RepID=UPI0037993638